MQLGNIIRVLEVPASVPAETAPHYVPEPVPAQPEPAPHTPAQQCAPCVNGISHAEGGVPWVR